jgi:WD40 repeat protein
LNRRALFYFLSSQWDDYDGIDFDRRMLRVLYQTGNTVLRRRITKQVQIAGRVEYLYIITGSAYQPSNLSELSEVTAEEAELLVYLLASKAEWAQLWGLVGILPLRWSIEVVRQLANQSVWQPSEPSEQVTLSQLKALLAGPLATDPYESSHLLNHALMRARIHVAGKVRAIAFAHAKPLLALATANCRVIVWNMQEATQEYSLAQFKYQLGALRFMPDDTLVGSEAPATNVPICRIYAWQGSTRFEVGQHGGAITALEVLDADHILSVGRDGRAVVWNIRTRSLVVELSHSIHTWSPAICRSLDGEYLALLHTRIDLYRVESHYLTLLASSPIDLSNSLKLGAFAPDGHSLVSGRFHGELTHWTIATHTHQLESKLGQFTNDIYRNTSVEGLVTVRDTALLLLGTSNGTIQYIEWNHKKKLGEVSTPGQKLSSMTLAPDGSFLAVGDGDSDFSLWDLRVLALSHLFSEPLAWTRPSSLGVFHVLHQFDLNLAPALLASLNFIQLVLEHRFRFDVEIAEFSTIRTGEFDIEILE